MKCWDLLLGDWNDGKGEYLQRIFKEKEEEEQFQSLDLQGRGSSYKSSLVVARHLHLLGSTIPHHTH
jgi:hypothetical protein